MKTTRLILVGFLVGAIGLAPTKLPLAGAAFTATASASALSMTTKSYGAVAGSSSAATATTAYAIPAFSSCAFSNNTQLSTASGATTIRMSSTTGFTVGMAVTATGITTGAVIDTINASPKGIVISIATTAIIGAGSAITAGSCLRYFSVNNIQNTALDSFGIQQSFLSTPGTVTMQQCSGTWNETTDACVDGSITTIVSGSVTSAITSVPIALVASPTGTARLRVSSTLSSVSVKISVFVRRATDVSAGTTTNS